MRVSVKMFAVARQIAGREVVEVSLGEQPTVADVRRALAADFPGLAPLAPQLMFAVNQEYAGDHTPVSPDSEIACIPPVSGG